MSAHEQPEPVTPKASPFAHDSTPELIKKMFIYKMMSSNVFINYSLGAMSLAYRTMGRRVTNTLIEQTAGTIFTGGVSVSDLCKDMDVLEKRNIGTISMMVVEGLTNAEESTLDYFYTISKDTVMQMSEGRSEAHFAVKLTAFVSLEVMEKISGAQKKFVHDVLALDYADRNEASLLTREQLVSNLRAANIVDYSEADLDQLVEQLSDKQGRMTPVSRYLGGHLFNLYRPMTGLEKQMAEVLGGMDASDFEKYATFVDRTLTFTDYANERNTSLYVDAEQSFIQYGIESFGQQLTHKYNRGDKVIIMNGYQCYTTRTKDLIPMEVAAAKEAGFNMGIKLIRGAYMMEERELAAQGGYESPVFDSIEGTHECYNTNMEHIITNMKEQDMILVASHNVETVEIAKRLTEDCGFKTNPRVRFGQLRGFSDQVTGELSNEGFKVYKYVPFGPTEQVMPYLVRRGQESRQVLREQKFQNEMLGAEIKARLFKF